MATRTIAVNDIGRRIGQDHHNAKLTDADVELLLQFHEAGWGYRTLAAKFEVSKSLVRDIVKGKLRGQTVAGHRSAPPPKCRGAPRPATAGDAPLEPNHQAPVSPIAA